MSNNNSPLEPDTNWDKFKNTEDKDIDLSDIPELTEEDFKRAKPSAQFLKERGIKFDATQPIVITEHQEDGTTITYELPSPEPLLVEIEPDIRKFFPDSESVNRTLRSLIDLIPDPAAKSA